MLKKEKITSLPISKFIDTRYRDYAIYVLEARGIPSFFDALTPVQRFILKNTAPTYNKTLSVVGKCFQDHYNHGDAGLAGAISKLARPFGNALQILNGYGFFGSEVSPQPAAARYTSVKLSSKANVILNQYKHLTTREEEGSYDPFWMDIPLGLTTSIVGIAVGYKTTILPRNLNHIKDFFEGRRKSVKPFFEGYNGNIEKYKGVDNAWKLSSIISVDEKTHRIQIKEIPPILKYNTVLKKIDNIISNFEGNVRIVNNSNTKVDIGIIYTGKSEPDWVALQIYVEKTLSIIVTENPVFIKDKQVLIYDNIDQYLEDYKWQRLRLQYNHIEWEKEKLKFELEFNNVKELFIEFILLKKRTNIEIDNFLKSYSKQIKEKLEALTARKFTKDELSLTKTLIKELTNNLNSKLKEWNIVKKEFENTKDPTLERGIGSKNTTAVNLFDTDDIEEIDGILVWDGADPFDETENIIDNEK